MADLEAAVESNGKALLLILVELETLHLYLLLKEAMVATQQVKEFQTKVAVEAAEAAELLAETVDLPLETKEQLAELELQILLQDRL